MWLPAAAGPRPAAVSLDLPIQRRSLLFVAPDFLGYMLAVGLCFMSLLITHSRDDLILAAVVSAAGRPLRADPDRDGLRLAGQEEGDVE